MATGGRKTHLQVMHEISLAITPSTPAQGYLGVLPAGSIANFAHAAVTTPFNSTTNSLTLGTQAGGAQILAAVDLKTAARTDTAVAIANLGPYATDVPIWYTITSTGAAPSAGAAVVWVDYLPGAG